ncbi:MAG: hypothetical protein Q9162_005289 [Coniocarpon cinnabarinum]
MAFQQPIQRPSTRRAATPPPITTSIPPSRASRNVGESQEWVLFSPPPPSEQQERTDADTAVYSATPVTPRTFNKSRLSDFGSLDSAAVSARHQQIPSDDREEDAEDEAEEGDEADSLDEGLHAFNEPASISNPSAHHCLDSSIADPVLPAHDGLGAFNGSSAQVQQQLWQHERYNPKRALRGSTSLRKSDVQKRLDALNEHEKAISPIKDPAEERNLRIEKWRLDQSRAIVEEIERETRRRRRRSRLSQSSVVNEETHDTASASTAEHSALEKLPVERQQSRWSEDKTLWTRTRKVIRDLIGVDDDTLTYIFGEAKARSEASGQDKTILKPTTPAEMVVYAEQTVPDSLDLVKTDHNWENSLITRIARELGTLVHQLAEYPPNTFSNYMRVQETVPYAGLPTPTDMSSSAGFYNFDPPAPTSRPTHHLKHRRRTSVARTDPSLFGIEEEPVEDEAIEEDHELTPQQTRTFPPQRANRDDAQQLSQEKAYWEQDLDIKLIFSYIKSRLRRRSSHSSPRSVNTAQSTAPTLSTAATSGPDALRRAALIRHHHPLVSRNLNALRTASQSNLNSSASQLPMSSLAPILGRRNSSVIDDGASSCASQSTKKSKTHHSGSLSITSSRNYWDIGGPSWGEV